MSVITVIDSDRREIRFEAKSGDVLLTALQQVGMSPAAPCGGRGVCAKCRVRVSGGVSPATEKERDTFGLELLQAGWRLACQCRVTDDCTVRLASSGGTDVCTEFSFPIPVQNPLFTSYGAAVDIGTTTVALLLFDASGPVSSSACVNPQTAFGADVISRIAAQISGKGELLKECIRECIEKLLREAALKAGIRPEDVDTAVITGNTAMLTLLTGTDAEPLSHMPFHAKDLFGRFLEDGALGLPFRRIYLPPCVGPYVGADITCAAYACALHTCSKPTVMVDIGTNGEMMLNDGKRLLCCSTAAGPALEGAGISCGMLAGEGAVSGAELSDGKVILKVIGSSAPKGICGSGVIDLTAALLQTEQLDAYGRLTPSEDGFPAASEGRGLLIADKVVFTQEDVRMVQLAKSAICAGLKTLISESGTNADEIETLFVAGGFGKHLNFNSAGVIGLLPPELAARAVSIGNAALAGAAMALCSASVCEQLEKLASEAKVFSLEQSSVFMDAYTDGMLFGDEDD